MNLRIYLGVRFDNGRQLFSPVRHLAPDVTQLAVSGDEFKGSEILLGVMLERIKNKTPPSFAVILEGKSTSEHLIVSLYDTVATGKKLGVVGVGAGEWFGHRLPGKLASNIDPRLRIDATLKLTNATVRVRPMQTASGGKNYAIYFEGDKVETETPQY